MLYTKNIQKHKAFDKFIDNMPRGKRREVGVELIMWNGNRRMICVFEDRDIPKCRYKFDKLLRLLKRLQKVNKIKDKKHLSLYNMF
jgi:hypothetical protein